MMGPNRRRFLQSMLAASAGALVYARPARPGSGQAHIVVVGNGIAGQAFIQAMRRLRPAARLTCIDPLAGPAGRDRLENLAGRVVDMDYDRKVVQTDNGVTVGYDAMVLAPGAEIRWGEIEGYTAMASERMPHSWIGVDRGTCLGARLVALPQGATVIIHVPGGVIRFPQGVNQRVRQISHYLYENKPRSKLLVLDARQRQLQRPFTADNVEWLDIGSDADSMRVDADAAVLHIAGSTYRADLINFIPPQQAGKLAHRHGLADLSGWCPVATSNCRSLKVPDVYVLGDASAANAREKSGASAVTQAIRCASHLADAVG